mgnify:CR=1 FL=1
MCSSDLYGIVTNLYAWTALLLVILTYGMETGFFRFANREDKNPGQVYTTILTCIGFTSLLFAVTVTANFSSRSVTVRVPGLLVIS